MSMSFASTTATQTLSPTTTQSLVQTASVSPSISAPKTATPPITSTVSSPITSSHTLPPTTTPTSTTTPTQSISHTLPPTTTPTATTTQTSTTSSTTTPTLSPPHTASLSQPHTKTAQLWPTGTYDKTHTSTLPITPTHTPTPTHIPTSTHTTPMTESQPHTLTAPMTRTLVPILRASPSPPPAAGVTESTTAGAIIGVISSPFSSPDALTNIQLLAIFAVMQCRVPGVGDESMRAMLSPLATGAGRFKYIIGQLILLCGAVLAYACLLGLVTLCFRNYEKARNLLRHPRFLPLLHLIALPGLTFESTMLAYGNDPPITIVERVIGSFLVLLCVLSIVMYIVILVRAHRRHILSDLAVPYSAANLARFPRIVTFTLLPKTWWRDEFLRTLCVVSAPLRPGRALIAGTHGHVRIILVSIICGIRPGDDSWCDGILICACLVCVVHAMFLIITCPYRIPINNVLQATQSVLVGSIAVGRVLGLTSDTLGAIGITIVAIALLSVVIDVTVFVIEWRVLKQYVESCSNYEELPEIGITHGDDDDDKSVHHHNSDDHTAHTFNVGVDPELSQFGALNLDVDYGVMEHSALTHHADASFISLQTVGGGISPGVSQRKYIDGKTLPPSGTGDVHQPETNNMMTMLQKFPVHNNNSSGGIGSGAMMSGDVVGVFDHSGTLPWSSTQFMMGSGGGGGATSRSSTPSSGCGIGEDVIVGLVTPRPGRQHQQHPHDNSSSNNQHRRHDPPQDMLHRYSPGLFPHSTGADQSHLLAASFGSQSTGAPWRVGGGTYHVNSHHQDRTPQVDPLNLPSMFLSTRSAAGSYNPNMVGSFASAADRYRRASLVSTQLRASTTFIDGSSNDGGVGSTAGAAIFRQDDSTSPTAQHLFPPSSPTVALYGADASFESQLLFHNSLEADGTGGLFRHLMSMSLSPTAGTSDQRSLGSGEGGGGGGYQHTRQLPPPAAVPTNTNNNQHGGGGIGRRSTLLGGGADSTLLADTHFVGSGSLYSDDLPNESPTSAPLGNNNLSNNFTHTLAFE